MEKEVILPGGNVGGAVRVGDTVRRATGPWTPAIHALLNYLADAGLSGVPRVHGYDERGPEVLDYLPGTAYGPHVPDDVLQAARLRLMAEAYGGPARARSRDRRAPLTPADVATIIDGYS
ncbi:MAG TPA: hypothetical protein VG497_10860 [Kribbella sp.]|nr:hypothetical protein [Kribbella sp.]